MDELKYTISIQDIKDYVATVPEGDPVGEPHSSYHCLVANTLTRKYSGAFSHIVGRNRGAWMYGETLEFPPDVFQAAEKFDALWNIRYEEAPITVAVLRERMPELFS